ncbi:MAG: thioredoxin family protein [Pseudomonadota bacterium]
MRALFLGIGLTALAACGGAPASVDERPAILAEALAPAEDTRLIAALSHADWCVSCKALDPKVAAVRAANTFDGVQFLALDYTARDTDAFFAMAAEAGIEDTVRTRFADGVKTGFVMLIDRDSGEILAELKKDMTEAGIEEAISAAAAAA